MSLVVSNHTFGSSSYLTVYKPDGSTLSTTCCVGNGTTLDMLLPVTGTYQVLVDPSGTTTGSETLTLSDEIDAGTIAINGSAVTVTIGRAGQRAHRKISR